MILSVGEMDYVQIITGIKDDIIKKGVGSDRWEHTKCLGFIFLKKNKSIIEESELEHNKSVKNVDLCLQHKKHFMNIKWMFIRMEMKMNCLRCEFDLGETKSCHKSCSNCGAMITCSDGGFDD